MISELSRTFRELPTEFPVAHFGLYPANDGSKPCWVKLTGIYRFSQDPAFADVKPFAKALMETVPDQLLLGIDFPHLSFHDKVGTIQLYNMLGQWAPDAAMRKRILIDNRARMFGFC